MVSEVANQVNKSITEMLNGVHTAVPGKVVTFDKGKCEAVIQPYGKFQKPDGAFIEYPQINEVPVMLFQGNSQKTAIVYPVLPGDECLLIMSEYTLDTWRGSGAQSENDLKFDLTNAVAIVGLFSKYNPLAAEAVDDDALIVEHNKNRVVFKGEDEIKVHLVGDTSQMTLKPDGITISTVGNISVEAKGNVSIDAKGTVAITAEGETTVDTPSNMGWHVGGDFEIIADGKITMKSAEMDVMADGNILIDGDRVDINPEV